MVRTTVTLNDKYILEDGGVYLTGTQALARLPMAQKRRDAAAGLFTAGFISGYRGSPLGGFDQELWSARRHLQAHDIHFQPGVNEDLGATAVWGSQQVGLWPGATVDGVFGLWYGKGPGVDRSGDVFKHANLAGVAPLGGVLAVAGDDHASKSSTAPHQSEQAFIAAGIPVLNPATVAEVLEFGLHGWAMSRYAGCWVALKALTEVVDSSASVVTNHLRPTIIIPDDFERPPGGLSIRWPDRPLVQEDRLFRFKLPAAIAYAKANRLDGEVWAGNPPRLGIVATGKGCLDALEALESLGLDRASAALLGIGFYKVGLVWPLEGDGMAAFARQYRTLLVVEEKRDIIEQQIKDRLYNLPADRRPLVVGKTDAHGRPLLSSAGELTPAAVAMAIGRVLEDGGSNGLEDDGQAGQVRARLMEIERREDAKVHLHPAMERAPHFCSGCPHNTSTKVPEGSIALGGIGCHYMATWMDRATETFSQMGGEGVAWVGQNPFTERQHVFANIGDGTYFHSGILAIRQAVAAKVNITYKLLYNDAVAMTGGQPVDGPLDVPTVIDQLRAEGVGPIVVVSNEPEKYGAQSHGIRVARRDDLDHVQRDLRETPGVTVLIYDQTCAAEQRRRRKRGLAVDPARRVVINDLVCEGCGDCSTQSNCLSVAPLETEFGRKRTIDQSSCNKDFSCVRGFCPSFVTLEGAEVRKGTGILLDADGAQPAPLLKALPDAALPAIGDRPFSILITGIGGTGVVTIGALIGMAAHIDGRTVSVLDQTGLAQKGGAVMSHVRIARPAGDSGPSDHLACAPGIAAQRIPSGGADALIGGDIVVSSGVEALARVSRGKTRAIINTHAVATGAFARNPDLAFPSARMLDDLRRAINDDGGENGSLTVESLVGLDATALATDLFGDTIASNLILLGMAWQKGLIPVSRLSLTEAIRLNGVAVATNLEAFEWGRRMAHDPGAVEKFIDNRTTRLAPDHHRASETLDEIIDRRISFLTSYQDAAYARRYNDLVTRIRDRETALKAGSTGSDKDLPLTEAVARSAFKLMANKDEYEVARLQSDPAFLDGLKKQFTGDFRGDFRMVFHLAPPIFAARDPDSGLPRKRAFGPWMLPVFRLLARMRRLRGTPFDLFGYLPERKAERALIDQYFGTMDTVIAELTISNLGTAIALADLPQTIRGYGHIRAKSMAAADARRSELLAAFLGGYQDNKDDEPVAIARTAAE